MNRLIPPASNKTYSLDVTHFTLITQPSLMVLLTREWTLGEGYSVERAGPPSAGGDGGLFERL